MSYFLLPISKNSQLLSTLTVSNFLFPRLSWTTPPGPLNSLSLWHNSYQMRSTIPVFYPKFNFQSSSYSFNKYLLRSDYVLGILLDAGYIALNKTDGKKIPTLMSLHSGGGWGWGKNKQTSKALWILMDKMICLGSKYFKITGPMGRSKDETRWAVVNYWSWLMSSTWELIKLSSTLVYVWNFS